MTFRCGLYQHGRDGGATLIDSRMEVDAPNAVAAAKKFLTSKGRSLRNWTFTYNHHLFVGTAGSLAVTASAGTKVGLRRNY
jgi:hypothetical protein